MALSLPDKLERMRAILRELGRVAVAYSGGVDSVFVLKVAVDTLGAENVLAVTGRSPSMPARDLDDARRLAAALGVRLVEIDPGEFEDPNYLSNPTDRCYHCKTALYRGIGGLLAEHRLAAVVSGTNADDLGDYRPGLAAAREQGVREPCAEVGLTKADIRALSAAFGLPTHDKPASPCLSSRLPYGEAITPEKLAMVDRAETFLREELGVPVCRVRYHEAMARVEVPPEWIERLAAADVRARIDAAFQAIGYRYVALDLRGFRSGSLNEVIAFGVRQG